MGDSCQEPPAIRGCPRPSMANSLAEAYSLCPHFVPALFGGMPAMLGNKKSTRSVLTIGYIKLAFGQFCERYRALWSF
jgi:hypothetical protein